MWTACETAKGNDSLRHVDLTTTIFMLMSCTVHKPLPTLTLPDVPPMEVGICGRHQLSIIVLYPFHLIDPQGRDMCR